MDFITAWLNTAGKYAITSIETTELLSLLSRTEDQAQRRKLINKISQGNLKLVYTTVKRYSDSRRFRWTSDRTLDLLQVGYEGLAHAVDRYDPKRGTRLSTIAVPWIRQRVGRHLIKNEQPIYTPEGLVREVHHFWATGEYSNTKKTPSNKQLVHIAAAAMSKQISLDAPVEQDSLTSLIDLIPQPETSNRAQKLDHKILELKDLMARAGLAPRVQDYLLIYAETGVKSTAFTKAGLNSHKGSPSQQMREAIDKLRDLV